MVADDTVLAPLDALGIEPIVYQLVTSRKEIIVLEVDNRTSINVEVTGLEIIFITVDNEAMTIEIQERKVVVYDGGEEQIKEDFKVHVNKEDDVHIKDDVQKKDD